MTRCKREACQEHAQIIIVIDGERSAVCADCYLHRRVYWPQGVFQLKVLA